MAESNTINPKFDFQYTPPQEGSTGVEGEQHTNFNPTSEDYPTRLNNVGADKFNEFERVILKIADNMGDVVTDMGGLTIGSKIRALEDRLDVETVGTQLLYVISTVGAGVLPGDINNDNYSSDTLNKMNGKFNVNGINEKGDLEAYGGVEDGYEITFDPGGGIIGATTNNLESVKITAPSILEVPESPTYTIGTVSGDDPALWSGGELHDITASSVFYLNHRFIKTGSMEYSGSLYNGDLTTVVAVNKDMPSLSAEAKETTFAVDLTTGLIEDIGLYTLSQNNPTAGTEWYFYYKYYGWRVDSVYVDVPNTGLPSIMLSRGTDISELGDLTNALMDIKNDYSSNDKIPLYLILVTPQNNISEDTTTICGTSNGKIKNCAYSKVLNTNENVIDLRRMLSPLGKNKKFTNGPAGNNRNLINLDTVRNSYLSVQADNNSTSLPSTYDPTLKMLAVSDKFIVDDTPIISDNTVVDVSGDISGYIATDVYVSHPDGSIETDTGSTNNREEDVTQPLSYINDDTKTKVASVITYNNEISTIIPAQVSKNYIKPVTGIGTIDGTSKELVVTHNMGCDCIAQAIPLQKPTDTPAEFPHVIAEYPNNNVVIFRYDNNSTDIQVLYTIVPTFDNQNTVDLDSKNIDVYHGSFANSPRMYSIVGSTTSSLSSEIDQLYIDKGYPKDTITMIGTSGSTYKMKVAEIKPDLIASYNASNGAIGGSATADIGANLYLTREVGVLVNFHYYADTRYWLVMNNGVNSLSLKFKSDQDAGTECDITILKD